MSGGSESHANPGTRYYKPGTSESEGFRVLPRGVGGQEGIKGSAYLKYFGGSHNGLRVPLGGLATMSEQQSRLHKELLDLGLEDSIPLPEAVAAPEVQAAVSHGDAIAAIRRALGELLRSGQIRLLRGPRRVEPHVVTTEDGLELLENPAWYRFRTEDPWEERLYFVNVDNLRDP